MVYDRDDFFNGRISMAQIAQLVETCESLKQSNRDLQSENYRLKKNISEVEDSLRVTNNDRSTLVQQFEKLKERLNSPETWEGKYVKVVTAMFAIANGVSNDDAKVLANKILVELGEKK